MRRAAPASVRMCWLRVRAERAAGLESAVRMHSRDQRLLGECALNHSGLAAEIVLCFPKYMLSLERRRATDQSVSHHPLHSYIQAGGFHSTHEKVAFISPSLRSSTFFFFLGCLLCLCLDSGL